MNQYKDFQGKTLDAAISEACQYYGVEREKLEIEIINDAKSGIFGLVGAKKANIRATRMQIDGTVSDLVGNSQDSGKSQGLANVEEKIKCNTNTPEAPTAERNKRAGRPEQAGRQNSLNSTLEKPENTTPHTKNAAAEAESGMTANSCNQQRTDKRNSPNRQRPDKNPQRLEQNSVRKDARPESQNSSEPEKNNRSSNNPPRQRRDTGIQAASAQRRNSGHTGSDRQESTTEPDNISLLQVENSQTLPVVEREDMPEFSIQECDEEQLFAVVRDVVQKIIAPIAGDVPCSVSITGNRVRATVECGDAAGLLVGREGQTLASVQYLSSCIIAKKIGGTIRLQIDVGNYRERQDDRLKEMALSLAEKVKSYQRSQSTKPLSAYQRRLVHLALENDDMVITRSKGEGQQRRVIIQLKRNTRAGKTGAPAMLEVNTPGANESTALEQPARDAQNLEHSVSINENTSQTAGSIAPSTERDKSGDFDN